MLSHYIHIHPWKEKLCMNKRLRSKYTSYLSVQTVLHKYEDEVNKVPVLKRYRDTLDNSISAIEEAEKEYQTVNVGTTGEKNTLALTIIEEMDLMCGALNVWAQENGDKKIEELTDLSITDIGGLKEPELSEKAKQILEICLGKKPELQEFDIPSEQIDEFGDNVNSFSDSLKKVKSDSDTSVVVHSGERQKFAETDKFIREKLDKVVKTRKKKNPEFVELYFKARVVKELGVRHEDNQNPPKPAEPQVQ
jgi:hypothetical protein